MSGRTAKKMGKLNSNDQIYKMSQEEHNKPTDYLFFRKTEHSESTTISSSKKQLKEKCYEHGNGCNAEHQMTIKAEVIEQVITQKEENKPIEYFLAGKTENSELITISSNVERQLKEEYNQYDGNTQHQVTIKAESIEQIKENNYILKEVNSKQELERQIIVNEDKMCQVEHNIQPLDYMFVPKTENSESIVINSNTEKEFKEKSNEQNTVELQKIIKIEVIEQIYDNSRTSDNEFLEGKVETQIDEEEDTTETARKRTTKHDRIWTHIARKPFGRNKRKNKFTGTNRFKLHLTIHSAKKKYACGRCSKRFISRNNLVSHIQTHTGKKSYVCNVCGTKYSTASNLERHSRIHSDKKKHVCNQCNKRYKSQPGLVYHMRSHTGEKLSACNICDKKFTCPSSLTRHLETHSKTQKKYICDRCSKRFTQRSTLVGHLRTHTGEKPYACNICDKKFTHSSHLKRHLRTHSDEKKYACDQCSKRFINHSYLVSHLRTHTGEKPYACNICDKKCAHSHHLKRHLRTHSDEKTHACDQCNKIYKSHAGLVYHIRTHTGEKPYLCHICDKRFTQSSNMTKHLRTHSGKKKVYLRSV